jgi:Bacterial Ig-like domain (group 2)
MNTPPLYGVLVIEVGDLLQFMATGVFNNGVKADFTTQVTWNSSNTMAAEISNDPIDSTQGLSRGIGEGVTTITATFNGISGSTSLTVEEYYSYEGSTNSRTRFASIIGTATLTVIMLGIFSSRRDGRARPRIRR